MNKNRLQSLKLIARIVVFNLVGLTGCNWLYWLVTQRLDFSEPVGFVVAYVFPSAVLLYLVLRRRRKTAMARSVFSQILGESEYPKLPFADTRRYCLVQPDEFIRVLREKSPPVCFMQDLGRGGYRFAFLSATHPKTSWLFQRARRYQLLQAWFFYYAEWIMNGGWKHPRGWCVNTRIPEDRLTSQAPSIEGLPESAEDALIKLIQWGRWSMGHKGLVFAPVQALINTRLPWIDQGRSTIHFY